jgi:hypothetical protein
LTIGETDPDLFVGNISWLFITQKSWWTLNIVGGSVGNVAVFSGSDQVIVDSGTSLILGPASKIRAIIVGIEAISGVRIRLVEGEYIVECGLSRKISNITFSLEGADGDRQGFTVTGESLVVGKVGAGNCLFGLQALADSPPSWILGDPFLRSFYTVYDYENARLGFAVSADASSTMLGSSGDLFKVASVTNIFFLSVLSLLLL